MPRIKKATDASGVVFYPITISKGVYDTDKNQRLSDTLLNKAEKSATVSTVDYDTTNKKITKTINSSTTDVVTASKIVTDGGGYKKPSGGIPGTDLATSYLPLTGGNMSGNIKFNAQNKGLYGVDSGGNEFPEVWYDNNRGLCIGGERDSATSHVGSTYISTGYNPATGAAYETAFVVVPDSENHTSTSHSILHFGNYKVNSEKLFSPSGSSLAGWYRVATLNTFVRTSSGISARAISFLLSVYDKEGNSGSATFIINTTSNTASIHQIGSSASSTPNISSVRVLLDSQDELKKYHIDLYYNVTSTTQSRNEGFSLVNLSQEDPTYGITQVDWTPQAASESLPSGVTLSASADTSDTFDVDKAAQLTTARTLWGQSFDGSANISGALTDVGSITPSATRTYDLGSSSRMFKRGYIEYLDTNSSYALKFCIGGEEKMRLNTSGNICLGKTTISSGYKMEIDGKAKATAWDTDSDERLKDVIEDKQLTLDEIADAPLVSFRYKNQKNDTGIHVGTIAQYWKSILPEVVSEDDGEDRYLSLTYSSMNAAMCISLAREVKKLVERVAELEERLGEKVKK